jgi:transcriptional regulatory protein LevR
VFSYEIPFELKREVIFEELKEKIKSVDRGAGVIAVYDMNFVGAMLEIIELELNIKIRQMPSPITSIGLELSRKAAIEENLDEVVRNVTEDMNIYKSLAKKVIVTLCTTGVGGAEELKKYIETYGDIGKTEIVALSMNDKKLLKEQLAEIMQTSVVHCIIGTFDPELYSIPFVSISDVLAANKAELPSILQLKQIKKSKFDFDEIYAYLEEQLEAVDINKLKHLLPIVIKEINEQITPMSLDTEIGLFIHISCCINRLIKKEKTQENIRKNEIIEQYGKQYRKLIKILKPIEKKFEIIITEDSIANMLIIINKI